MSNAFLKTSVKNNAAVSSIAWYMSGFLTLRNFAKSTNATALLIQAIQNYHCRLVFNDTNYHYMKIYNLSNYDYKQTYKTTNYCYLF